MKEFDKIFSGSYFRILGNHEKAFFDSFYERFMDSSPVVREKFRNTNMEKQKQMLKKSLHHVLDFYILNQISPEMERIAKIHSKSRHNVTSDLYDLWTDCLVQTVREYDAGYNDDVELAWRMVLSSGITYMKFNYDK